MSFNSNTDSTICPRMRMDYVRVIHRTWPAKLCQLSQEVILWNRCTSMKV